MSKQAVVVIHGIGEQRPMSTLRNFVEAVMSPQLQEAIGAKQAVKVKKTDYRSKPDRLSESFELRRLDYVDKRANRTTHFYEYYWADRMRKTRFAHLFGWMARLLFLPWGHLPWRRWWRHLRNRRRISLFRNIRRNWFRDLKKVPPQHRRLFRLFRGIWLILFLLPIVSLTGFLIFSVVPGGNLIVLAFGLPGVVAIGRLVWEGIFSGLLNSAGDAARYLNAAPANIAERHAIRTNGIALLKKLHDPTSGYDRIVIVGHSLGSVIGYDMLTHYWAQVNGDIPIHPGSDESMALNRLEAPDQTINDFQKNQDCLWKVLATRSLNNCQAQRWLVSDFVTVGSPLSYGAFLFAESSEDFKRRVGQRELPVCPPISNGDKRPKSFAWKDEKHGLLYLHHAAQFTLTQWTNFYFPGDPLAGKLAEVFSSRDVPGEIVTRGPGICDIELEHPSRRHPRERLQRI
jgi:hypothetical protein